MSEEIIDGSAGASGEVPQALKTLGILSIIGNALWGLLLLIGMFWVIGASSSMPFLPPGSGDMIAIIIIVMLIFIALNVFGLMAALKMMNGNKKAFTLYAIVTSIWALLMLLGSNGDILTILFGVISIGFIIAFNMQLKKIA
jgi:hypothetical protein